MIKKKQATVDQTFKVLIFSVFFFFLSILVDLIQFLPVGPISTTLHANMPCFKNIVYCLYLGVTVSILLATGVYYFNELSGYFHLLHLVFIVEWFWRAQK